MGQLCSLQQEIWMTHLCGHYRRAARFLLEISIDGECRHPPSLKMCGVKQGRLWRRGIACLHLIYTECPHSMTEINWLEDRETQYIDVNTRYSVCERGGSEEGHWGRDREAKHQWHKEVWCYLLKIFCSFINCTREKCSPVEISIL